ncbi:hypothetical protein DSM104299_04434 [Baekduia alba]|nr:hypothetical protein DSM104299_04434 [Baekduia alba]
MDTCGHRFPSTEPELASLLDPSYHRADATASPMPID